MPRDQQWYWEFNYNEAIKAHTQKIWLSQMPADDYEALQGKNDAVFDDAIIVQLEQQRQPEFQDWGILGDSIDEDLQPDETEIWYGSEAPPRKIILWRSNRGQRYQWTLVPLKPVDPHSERKSLDRIRVWKEPEKGHNYSFGIDTADGLGHDEEDRAVLSIADNVEAEACDEQCAEFVSNRVNSPQMVGFAACLGAWYGQGEDSEHIWTKDPRGVKFCIEQRERSGDDCQLQLKLMGFNFHHVYLPGYDQKKPEERRSRIEGFRTNAITRPILTGRFCDAINNGWYKPHSPWLIAELRDWERRTLVSGKTRMDHRSGKHDDRIFAAAMSYFTRHTFDVMADRSSKRYALPVDARPEVNYDYNTSMVLTVED